MDSHVVRVKVSGEYACFSRPEAKVERFSYDVPTPSAARGILDAILWKPEMRWHVLKVEVLKPIRFQAMKRNELQSKVQVSGKNGVKAWMANPATYKPQAAGAGSEDATPRNTMALRDVAYIIHATPIVFHSNGGENSPKKYCEMFHRRVEKGQCFHTPALGCREFVAHFEPPSGDECPINETRDLGLMLYDIIFDDAGKKNRPVFFQAAINCGVVFTDAAVVLMDEGERKEVLSCSFKP